MATILLRVPVEADAKVVFDALAWAQILPRLKKLTETGTSEPFFDF